MTSHTTSMGKNMVKKAAAAVPYPHPSNINTGAAIDTLAVPTAARQWTGVAVGSLVVAGLLSLAVVIGRLPVISPLIADPLFYQRCLVVHVDMALLVWFYAFVAAMTAMRSPTNTRLTGRIGVIAAITGMLAMITGAAIPSAEPVLANYIPVIDHPVFLTGLALFFAGLLVFLFHNLLTPQCHRAGGLPSDAAQGIHAAAIALILAATTWISAQAGLPRGLDSWTYYEFSAWGAGHVLQVANVCAMLAAWLWLLKRATGKAVMHTNTARTCFILLLAPHFIMPLLSWRGSLNTLYIDGATQLMRWGIFPIVLIILFLCLRHLKHHKIHTTDFAARACRAGFIASASLTIMGFLLGAMIRGSTTLVPAHYHASLGAVTAAFMAGSFLIIEAAAKDRGQSSTFTRLWQKARWQLILFGYGQATFAAGFGIGGLFGLGRKTYAAEQHIRSSGELVGLGIMGIGGLIAVVAGLWFLFLVLREMRHWLHFPQSLPQPPQPTTTHE